MTTPANRQYYLRSTVSEQQPPDAVTGTAYEDSLNLSDISDSAVEETLVFEVIREEETEMGAITLPKFSGNPRNRAEDWQVWCTEWAEEKMKYEHKFLQMYHKNGKLRRKTMLH